MKYYPCCRCGKEIPGSETEYGVIKCFSSVADGCLNLILCEDCMNEIIQWAICEREE